MDIIHDPVARALLASDPAAQQALKHRARAIAAEQSRPVIERGGTKPSITLDVRDDPRAGLQWVLDIFGATTVVVIHPDSGEIEGYWLSGSTIDNATTWVEPMSKAGFNIYFTINTPQVGMAKKPAKKDIVSLRAAAFADIDAKGGRTMDDALDRLLILPRPSAVIMSGGGYQPVWLLPKPIDATPDAVAGAEARSKRIAALVDGDAVGNVDRILRLPFTRNFPNRKKRNAGRTECLSGLVRIGDAP